MSRRIKNLSPRKREKRGEKSFTRINKEFQLGVLIGGDRYYRSMLGRDSNGDLNLKNLDVTMVIGV